MARQIVLLLFRFLPVVAAYAIEFAVFWQYPIPDRLFFIIPGTLLAILLVLIKKDQIVGVLGVAGFTIIGALIGIMGCSSRVRHPQDAPGHEIIVAAIAAAVGGLLGLGYSAIQQGEERV